MISGRKKFFPLFASSIASLTAVKHNQEIAKISLE
jgi:hypothetical protein